MISRQKEDSGSYHQLLCDPTGEAALSCCTITLLPKGQGNLHALNLTVPTQFQREHMILIFSSYLGTCPEKTMPIWLNSPNIIDLLD